MTLPTRTGIHNPDSNLKFEPPEFSKPFFLQRRFLIPVTGLFGLLLVWLFYSAWQAHLLNRQREQAQATLLANEVFLSFYYPPRGKLKAWVKENFRIDFQRRQTTCVAATNVRITKPMMQQIALYSDAREIFLFRCQIPPESWHTLAGFDQLKHLRLKHMPLNSEQAKFLDRMQELEDLHLTESQVQDDIAPCLGQMKNLKVLDLEETQVTDQTLQALSQHKHLEKILLKNTDVTDAGVQILAGLPALKYVSLEGTRVTNACLLSLDSMPNLKFISLYNTQVTQQAAREYLHQNQTGLKISYTGE